MDVDWQFLLDENVEPRTADVLWKSEYHADRVVDVLEEGADDHEDIVPWAISEGAIVVTHDVTDFGQVATSSSEAFGVVLIHDQDASAFELGNALIDLAEAYPGPEAIQTEVLDDWL